MINPIDQLQATLHEAQIPQEIDSETGLPIGPLLEQPQAARTPQRKVLEGQYCRLEPLDPVKHSKPLFQACCSADAAARFRYLPDEAPANQDVLNDWVVQAANSCDPLFFAVIDKRSGKVEGRQSLMRITPEHQVVEIGNIFWGAGISRTQVSTEANYLFACYAFELGYRRFEWKCDALNAPSRKAALRFGFTFEGLFRRAVIIRGRSRDTAWYSILAEEWPALQKAYDEWLSEDNFDASGLQKRSLASIANRKI